MNDTNKTGSNFLTAEERTSANKKKCAPVTHLLQIGVRCHVGISISASAKRLPFDFRTDFRATACGSPSWNLSLSFSHTHTSNLSFNRYCFTTIHSIDRDAVDHTTLPLSQCQQLQRTCTSVKRPLHAKLALLAFNKIVTSLLLGIRTLSLSHLHPSPPPTLDLC